MIKHSFRFLGTALFAAVMASCFCAGASNVQENPDYSLIDSFIQSQMEDCRIPGFSVGIIRGNDLVYMQGYGRADETGRAVTPQTPFVVGSVSKTMTALAVMQLAEEGKVALDKPVQTYLPSFALADGSMAAAVTVRQLMNHTSGIPTEAEFQAASLRGDDETISGLVGKFGVIAPASKPGEKFRYGNANYIILGELIQKVSGMSYGEYMKTRIFDPLEMHHSHTTLIEAAADGLAVGYRSIFGFAVPSGLPYRQDFLPAASIISCAEDMTHFMMAMQNGGRYKDAQVLSAQGIGQMMASSSEVSRWVSYGLGWYVTSGSIYHGGELSDYQAKVKLLTEDGLGIVLMYNTSSSTLGTLLNVGYRDRIETGIINVLYGADPMDQPGRNPLDLNSHPTALSYALLQFLLILIVLLLALSLFRLRSLGRRFQKSKAARRRIGLVTILVHLLFPLILLFGIPFSAGVSWAFVLYYVPDIGWFALGLAAALLLTGSAKGMIIYNHSGRRVRSSQPVA